MKKIISFHPEEEVYDIGTIICPKVDPEFVMMITGIRIHDIDQQGFVKTFDYECHNADQYHFYSHLEITESIIHQRK